MDDLVATLVATLMRITIYCIEKAFQPQYIVIRRLWQGRREMMNRLKYAQNIENCPEIA